MVYAGKKRLLIKRDNTHNSTYFLSVLISNNSHYKSISIIGLYKRKKDKSKQFSQKYATKSALYHDKVQNKYIKLNITLYSAKMI